MSTLGAALTLAGERKSGQDVRTQNVMAASSIANIVKSSLGPVGLDKMMVDEVGDVTITNDGATILQLLEVEHPAAKVLVELAALQDEEVGDGTTSVVIIAAELLQNADELGKQKVHPTSIIKGYMAMKAMKVSVKYIKEHLTYKVDYLGENCLINASKSWMSSKLIGADSEFFFKMVVEAAQDIWSKSVRKSLIIKGYALNCTTDIQKMRKSSTKAKLNSKSDPVDKIENHDIGGGVNAIFDKKLNKNPRQLDHQACQVSVSMLSIVGTGG